MRIEPVGEDRLNPPAQRQAGTLCHVSCAALHREELSRSALGHARKSRIKGTTETCPWGAGFPVTRAPFLLPELLKQLEVASSAMTCSKTSGRLATAVLCARIQRDDPDGLTIASDPQLFTVGIRPVTDEIWPPGVASPTQSQKMACGDCSPQAEPPFSRWRRQRDERDASANLV